MSDRLNLSNDTLTAPQGQGISYDEHAVAFNPYTSETSAHGTAAIATAGVIGPMKANGRIVDFIIGVVKVAVSASGFVSANISANVRTNSASCLSTIPSIVGPIAGSATQQVRVATNKCSAGNGVSAVVNGASANFSAGDMICVDWVANSAGSAAAAAAGVGGYVTVLVRYSAQ